MEGLLESWDLMSEHYLNGRTSLLGTTVEQLVQRFASGANTIVELGSGPGTLLSRLAAAMPSSTIIGVEIDPVLIEIHRLGTARAASDRVQLLQCDLQIPGWFRASGVPAEADAVVAVQVMHYLPPAQFARLLDDIRSILVPGGLFVHLDRVPPTTIGYTSEPSTSEEPDPWSTWWSVARATPVLTDAFRAHDQRHNGSHASSAEYHPDERGLMTHLQEAGLGTVVFERRVGGSLLSIVRADEKRPPLTRHLERQ